MTILFIILLIIFAYYLFQTPDFVNRKGINIQNNSGPIALGPYSKAEQNIYGPKMEIDRVDILSLNVATSTGYEHTFEIWFSNFDPSRRLNIDTSIPYEVKRRPYISQSLIRLTPSKILNLSSFILTLITKKTITDKDMAFSIQ